MKVLFTRRAQRRVKLVATWWREQRPSSPALFDEELSELVHKLIEHPTIGAAYQTIGERVIRRKLMPRTAQHVYYSVDESRSTVVVHTIWGARRARGPKL